MPAFVVALGSVVTATLVVATFGYGKKTGYIIPKHTTYERERKVNKIVDNL